MRWIGFLFPDLTPPRDSHVPPLAGGARREIGAINGEPETPGHVVSAPIDASTEEMGSRVARLAEHLRQRGLDLRAEH